MSDGFSESVVEDAAVEWLERLSYTVIRGPDIAINRTAPERSDPSCRDVVLGVRLRKILERLNPDLTPEALDDDHRKLIKIDAPSLIDWNRTVRRLLADGVAVEYRRADGSIGDSKSLAQAREM